MVKSVVPPSSSDLLRVPFIKAQFEAYSANHPPGFGIRELVSASEPSQVLAVRWPALASATPGLQAEVRYLHPYVRITRANYTSGEDCDIRVYCFKDLFTRCPEDAQIG